MAECESSKEPVLRKISKDYYQKPDNQHYVENIARSILEYNTLVALTSGLELSEILGRVFDHYQSHQGRNIVFVTLHGSCATYQYNYYRTKGTIPKDRIALVTSNDPIVKPRIWAEKKLIFTSYSVLEQNIKQFLRRLDKYECIIFAEIFEKLTFLQKNIMCHINNADRWKIRIVAVTDALHVAPAMTARVISNLKIRKLELRNEHSIDVRRTIKPCQLKAEKIERSEQHNSFNLELSEIKRCLVDWLKKQRVIEGTIGLDSVEKIKAKHNSMRKHVDFLSEKGKSIDAVFNQLRIIAESFLLSNIYGLKSAMNHITNTLHELSIPMPPQLEKLNKDIEKWLQESSAEEPHCSHQKIMICSEAVDRHLQENQEGGKMLSVVILVDDTIVAQELELFMRTRGKHCRPHIFNPKTCRNNRLCDQCIRNDDDDNVCISISNAEIRKKMKKVDMVFVYSLRHYSALDMIHSIGITSRENPKATVVFLYSDDEELDYLNYQWDDYIEWNFRRQLNKRVLTALCEASADKENVDKWGVNLVPLTKLKRPFPPYQLNKDFFQLYPENIDRCNVPTHVANIGAI